MSQQFHYFVATFRGYSTSPSLIRAIQNLKKDGSLIHPRGGTMYVSITKVLRPPTTPYDIRLYAPHLPYEQLESIHMPLGGFM